MDATTPIEKFREIVDGMSTFAESVTVIGNDKTVTYPDGTVIIKIHISEDESCGAIRFFGNGKCEASYRFNFDEGIVYMVQDDRFTGDTPISKGLIADYMGMIHANNSVDRETGEPSGPFIWANPVVHIDLTQPKTGRPFSDLINEIKSGSLFRIDEEDEYGLAEA